MFEIIKQDEKTKARLGRLRLAHGVVETPVFMPVATRGVVKTATSQELVEIGIEMLICNAYHLMLRPGMEVISGAGGLHSFMQWSKPLVSDSGGFQIFSLSRLNKVTDAGVHFQSHIDGTPLFLGPKESMEMQKALGADIVMCFDEYPPNAADKETLELAVRRTIKWAEVCRKSPLQTHQNLFSIVQGGGDSALRRLCAQELQAMNFAGYAIGGLFIGESSEDVNRLIEDVEPFLPAHKPRYLMGVGTPLNIIEAVLRGVDMFDCVLPTRAARGGTLYTWQGKIQIMASKYAKDFSPLDPELESYASKFSKAYIRHLFNVGEITGLTLATVQNLAFYLDFMVQLRASIREGTLSDFYEKVASIYPI